MAIAARGDKLIRAEGGLLLHSQECCEECVPCKPGCPGEIMATAVAEFTMEHGGILGYPVETYSGVFDTWADISSPGLVRFQAGGLFDGSLGSQAGQMLVVMELFCFGDDVYATLGIGNNLLGGYAAYSDPLGQVTFHRVPTRRVDGECVFAGDAFVSGSVIFDGVPLAWMFRVAIG